jgi:predicted nuclease of predicted toxin-antitoxin system
MINSSIKFIVDAGVGKVIEEWLIQQGFDVVSIITKNPEMSDSEILKLAKIENAIIITMDKDFGELIYKDNALHSGILLLRLDDAMSEEKLSALQNIFPEHLQNLKNHFSVYQNGKLRTR